MFYYIDFVIKRGGITGVNVHKIMEKGASFQKDTKM